MSRAPGLPVRELADGRGLVKISQVTRAVLDGTEDLSTWTEEELARGIKRGRDGKFRKPPRLVAKAVHDELVRRKMTKAYDLLKESTYKAVKVLVEIALDPQADPAVRAKCASEILDRTIGKPVERMQMEIDTPAWLKMVEASIVAHEPSGSSEVIEGEVVEAATPDG